MNKTAIQNLARISQPTPPPVAKKQQQKRTHIVDIAGLKIINDLVEILGSVNATGKALGVAPTNLNAWRNGEPVRQCYTKLAAYIIAEEKAKRAPKIVLKAQQHTAVVTLSNEHEADFRQAVESVGGQYTLLSYPS